MPTYKLKLEVEISCPVADGHPELTITPAEIRKALMRTDRSTNGYAVCAENNPSKRTATMHVKSVEFEPLTCEHCGNKIEVP